MIIGNYGNRLTIIATVSIIETHIVYVPFMAVYTVSTTVIYNNHNAGLERASSRRGRLGPKI